jgi:hypothetical protein
MINKNNLLNFSVLKKFVINNFNFLTYFYSNTKLMVNKEEKKNTKMFLKEYNKPYLFLNNYFAASKNFLRNN